MEFVYALINFILLFGLIWLVGRKAIAGIFGKRLERINSELDEAEKPLPEPEALPEPEPVADLKSMVIEEETAEREVSLKSLAEQFEADKKNMRLEMLLETRTRLVNLAMEKAREYMLTDRFRAEMKAQETQVADKMLELIHLTPGDMMYLKRKGVLYVTLLSPYPLEEKTVEKIHGRIDELLSQVGGAASFLVKDAEEDLLGGFRLRIGDTVYDYSVRDRLYRLKESLNNMPLSESDAKSMYASIEKAVSDVDIDIDVFQVGRVLTVSDGICWMDGLSDIMYGEIVEFSDAKKPLLGLVLDVQPEKIGCVIFGHYDHVDSYSRVRRLGRMAMTKVGEELLGRVVDATGEPIDGKGRIWTHELRPIECQAPAIPDRQPVTVPLETGIKAIDALVPIGRGQRELIIGDRQTGKSAVIVDTIINQKDKGVYCIYVAIGQKETSVATMVSRLEEYGAMDYTTIVCASASDSASLQYIAPFVGAAMAEYFMYKGKDALVIYDDLSKHAVAYRELSLLLHRPSGREAYPGDIFYLHSRLLERAARLSDEKGGGSVTALPVIETLAGDISAYIPTNVISITDGQIFLDADLFNAGQRPAINVGLSVSRVGGAAQTPFMKQVASNLRTSLAQYREYATFAQFGSDVDEATRKTLKAGELMMAALKQDRFEPEPVWQQAALIYAVSNGAADSWESDKMWLFEKEFISWIRAAKPELCERLKTGAKLNSETKAMLDKALEEFAKVA